MYVRLASIPYDELSNSATSAAILALVSGFSAPIDTNLAKPAGSSVPPNVIVCSLNTWLITYCSGLPVLYDAIAESRCHPKVEHLV